MLRLSLILYYLLLVTILPGQTNPESDSPHGENLQIDCKKCHTTSGWTVDRSTMTFSHDSTSFSLEGQHIHTDCRSCHETLVFNDAKTECINCHSDVHQQTVGIDCARCHNPQSWLVNNIAIIHENASFPLEGVHFGLDCNQCHSSATDLAFYPIQPDCAVCHQQDFDNTTNPDHIAAGYSTNCIECHNLNSYDWSADNFYHDFFPLSLGHDIKECSACHENNNFSSLPTDCYACHQSDYDNTRNPNHISGNFSVSCTDCHTTNPDWKPADFLEHDTKYFPIYQGDHAGEWNDCMECHKVQDNFDLFSCTHCHEHSQNDMAEEHENVDGYVYEDNACYGCHPTGSSDHVFNHDNSIFPLTGFHKMVNCNDCHSAGYSGTPTDCYACHEQDYNASINPDHKQLNLSLDCASCHTTDPDWVPASFDIHNDIYELKGAHSNIANDCISCHNGDYNNTPNDCYSCHQQDYETAMDPPHNTLSFSHDCISCHTEDAWSPSTFDHDMQFFPIYSGSHEGEWNNCNDCHNQSDNYSLFSCIDCHTHNITDTDEQHQLVNGYSYESQACYACHPTGTADDVFDHNLTSFPLTGAHTMTNCFSCHENGYAGTPTDCFACHQEDFESTSNPDHPSIGLSMDCASCHTTDPGWQPASFDIHDDFHPLTGAHNLIRNDCASCHEGNYINTPNTCFACHQEDYNNSMDPPHSSLQFSTDCASCHDETAWTPSSFEHDGQYFPIFSGKHLGEWDNCADCHNNSSNYAIFSCTNCHAHQQTEMDEEHQTVGGYVYESQACFACHPTGNADEVFDHNLTAFPLTGAHIMTDCIMCHANGYSGTPTDCFACHENDFNQSINPNHQTLGISNNCVECHTTDPGWSPAQFDIHSTYYPLTGAHQLISGDCAACHNNDYNNTPNECAGCHQQDFNETLNPNHSELGLSLDCASCHTTDPAWMPAEFPVHDSYFMLNGAHANIANDCATCHNGDYNNTPNTCFGCHQQEYEETTNPDHELAQFSTDCASCHQESSWTPSTFDHDGMYFPIYSGEHQGEWSQCIDCHTTPGDYSLFSCTICHINPETDEDHEGINGYVYSDLACFACHPTGNADDNFNHGNTGFPLLGAHGNLDCILCHENGFINTSSECVSCHLSDYASSSNPDHEGLGLSTDCNTCHTSEPGWEPASFAIHNDFYPLTGAHISIANDCIVCHNGDYNNTPNDCAGCHTDDYNASLNPNHQSLGLPTDCSSCHNTDPGWEPALFPDHNDYYALTGAHVPIANDCMVCHNGDYNNTPNDCAGCHTDDYNASTNPNHQLLGMSTDCAACHSTEPGWEPASFDNHNDYYVLTGAHIAIANNCAVCHNGDYNNTPNDCSGCHISDYNAATNPDHQQLGISTDCVSCHSTDPGWQPASFELHDDYYPLTGAHIPIANDCVICHNGDYNNTPNDCAGCHISDYNSSSNPDHQQLGLSNDCVTCHTTDPGWEPASFDIHNDFYPLTGAHAQIADNCTVCHNGDYNNTPNDCFGCHESDYNNTIDPDHLTAQFPTDCQNCHTDMAWVPSTFDHDGMYFPIYSGKHDGEWNQCSDCHSVASNYSIFDCLGCHTNPQTDEDHSGVNGYSYDSPSCFACHPDGED